MNRREFIHSCAYTCIAITGISVILQSCTATKYIQLAPENNLLIISRSEFITTKNDKTRIRRYIVVNTSNLNYPIVLFRFSDNDFSALLLECTHQGTELNINGDLLTCPAHGSEFSNKGTLLQGPADKNLKSFHVTSDQTNIYIHLS